MLITADGIFAAGYSVKPLDLSRPLSAADLAAAGQLGGPLQPTRVLTDSARDLAINASFGVAIQAWNQHQYRDAVKLFWTHLSQYPDSPWASEASLHCGCDALYNGRYSEAAGSFQWILQANATNKYPGAQKLAIKAHVRLANLKTLQGNFNEAMEHLRIVKQTSPDWRDGTYASHWIQRLSRETHNKQAVLSCGAQALACLLEKRGKIAAAQKVRGMLASSPRGQSMKDLKSIAALHDYRLTGVRLSVPQLKKIPLPAIVQLTGLNKGDMGHYWVLEKHSRNTLTFYDPQSRRRFNQTSQEFSREWGGNALVFAQGKKLPGVLLPAEKMAGLYGACCGTPRAEDNLGNPDNLPSYPDYGGGVPSTDKPGCGAPAWLVNKVSMNFIARDIPMWYRPPIGPGMQIALTYNSQSAIAVYEPFGNKWQFNYATYTVQDSGGKVTVIMPDGRRDVYTPNGSGGYIPPPQVYNTLVQIAANSFQLWFPNGTVYIYDIPAGTNSLQPFLVGIQDAHGLGLSFGYDVNVNLTTITDAMGFVTTLAYNAAGQVSQVTDPFGRQATFSYDSNANLTQITDMGGYWSSFAYDQNCYMTSIANSRGVSTFYTEPADGIMNGSNGYPPPGTAMWQDYRITVTNPLGSNEEYYYCGLHPAYWHVSPVNYVSYVSPSNNNSYSHQTKFLITTTTDGNIGKISSISMPAGGFEFYMYDAVGNLTYFNDGVGTWHYAYNSMGQITSVTNPNDVATTLTYAPNNVDPISIQDGLGILTFTYDAYHDVTSATDRMGNTTNYAYNSYGQVISVQDALGIVTNYNYDSWNRLAAVTRAGQTLHQYTYDALDRVSTHTDPTGLTLTYAYNNLDQVTTITYPDGKFTSYQYSTCCPYIVGSITARSGQTTSYSYDQLNHLLTVTDPAGGATSFTYDANSNRAGFTDPNGNTTSFSYDFNNRLTTKTFADGTHESFTYDPDNNDASGLVRGRTNARGVTTAYGYTATRQLFYFGDTNGSRTYYFYDNFDRMTRAWNEAVGDYFTHLYTYDANSRLVTLNNSWLDWGMGANVNFQYDALGRRAAMTRDMGQAVTYTYDNLNRLTGLSVGGQAYTYTCTGASPLVQSLTQPNGSVTTYQYDIVNRLTQMTTTLSGNTLTQYTYTYNAQDLRDAENYIEPQPRAAYSNELDYYTCNDVNELTTINNPGQKDLVYDASGNLVQGYTPAGYQFTAAYDSANHLTSFTYTDGNGVVNNTQYTYLGNLLLEKTQYMNGTKTGDTRYVFDGSQATQERNGNNNVVNEYTWGLGLPGGIGGLLQLVQTNTLYSYLYDGKGNVTALLNAAGQPAAAYQYDPFGQPQTLLASITQPMGFSTKAYDPQTGLS
ncbi:MAG: cysteine peptidase family C39 domain-containing protein, partial [Syntrophobacteraceae bacterium]